MSYSGYLPEASNRADWQVAVMLNDADTGDLIDISGCRVTLSVRPLQIRPDPFYDAYSHTVPIVLTGSTDDGTITLPELGVFNWLFPASRMASLCAGAYVIGVRISQDDRVMQLIVGNVNVEEGIDTQ